jgi:rhodanese-related sulfurtransferase
MAQIRLIEQDELREKLERGDDFKLVNTRGEWAFRAKHIPGSIHFPTIEEALASLRPEEEIVVYCADVNCPASVAAYRTLERNGYHNLRRYAGGVREWEEAGLPLEGDALES